MIIVKIVGKMRTCLLLCYLITSLYGLAQNNLQFKIDSIVNHSIYKDVQLGISVRDADSGEILADVHKDMMMIPASSLKLITTLSSLDILGNDFRYETRVSYDGILHDNGILEGNVYIEGSGDPSLGSDRIPGVLSTSLLLSKIVQDIKKAGILCIEGKIIADASSFGCQPVSSSWHWSDLGNYYAAGAWALNIHENSYNLWYECDGPVGTLTKIAYYEPHIPELAFENDVRIGKAYTGDNAFIFGGPYTNIKKVTGTLPKGKSLYKIRGSMPDPTHFFTFSLKKELEKNNMGSDTVFTLLQPDQYKYARKEISNYRSPDLKTLVKYTNESSINLYAESILRTLGLKEFRDGSDSAGIAALKKQLFSIGFDESTFTLDDGSGLSTKNQVSADLLSRFLVQFLKSKDRALVKEIIPSVGERGTVKRLLVNSEAKGKIWAKSGSMNNVLSYTGYCETESGRFIAFSIILNTHDAQGKHPRRAELEKILEAIYKFC